MKYTLQIKKYVHVSFSTVEIYTVNKGTNFCKFLICWNRCIHFSCRIHCAGFHPLYAVVYHSVWVFITLVWSQLPVVFFPCLMWYMYCTLIIGRHLWVWIFQTGSFFLYVGRKMRKLLNSFLLIQLFNTCLLALNTQGQKIHNKTKKHRLDYCHVYK